MHLLKWKFQPSRRCASWEISIIKQRNHAKRQINKNPSLKCIVTEIVNHAYEDARYEAAQETELSLKTFDQKLHVICQE